MDRKIITKVLAAMLAFTLTFANVILLGIYTQETYAASSNLDGQSTEVSKADMEFDAYFLEEGVKTHSKDIDVGLDSDNLYLSLKVEKGYLSNAVIKIENAKFKLAETETTSKFIQSIDADSGIIYLNQIDKEESVVLEIPILMNTDSSFDVDKYNEETQVKLEGTYVNNQAKEVKVSKEIKIKTGITAEAEAILTQEVNKYVEFSKGDKKGVILQTLIKSNLLNNVLPVKKTELTIEIPKIDGKLPNKVAVSAISTEATNGNKTKVYSESDYTKTDEKITLVIENNVNEDGKVSWMKNVQDEIVLTYIYEDQKISEDTLKLKAQSKLELYGNKEKDLTKEVETEVKEKVGDTLTFSIDVDKKKLQKGYMEVEGANNTPYIETLSANIGYKELVDSITLEENIDYIDQKSHPFTAKPIYTYTKIDSETFLGILGEEGFVKIYNKEGEEIATLDKDHLEYKYEKETTYIKIETSKPLVEGILKIENGREIKPLEYSKAQTKLFNSMKATVTGKGKLENKDIIKADTLVEIALKEPETFISASINKNNLSTVEANDGIEMQFILDTNDISKSLYKNPTITLEFPSYIDDLKDGKIGMLYGQGLALGNAVKYKENGKVYVNVPIIGEQTAYNTSAVTNGAKITIYGSLVVNEITPAVEDTIKVYVTNENSNPFETEIKIVYGAQNKVITRNTISGYDEENKEVKALEGEENAKILPNTKGKTAKVSLDIVNSTDKNINNVEILGRIPAQGVTDPISGEDLGNTFTANMESKLKSTFGIEKDDITIYYSENENANKTIDQEWTDNPSKLSEIKSYLIDLGDTELKTGDRVSFTYDVKLPENIGENLETNSAFAVFYEEVNENSEEAKVEKIAESAKVGLKTSKIAETPQGEIVEIIDEEDLSLSVALSSSGKPIAQDATVKEGQYVDYTVTMTNKTDKELTFDLEVTKENGTFYGLYVYGTSTAIEEYPLHIYGELEDESLKEKITIKPKETINYKYCIVANKDTEGSDLISNVSIKQNDIEIKKLSTSNTITEGLIKLCVAFNTSEEWQAYTDKFFPIHFDITNISGRKLSDIEVSIVLPDILSFIDYSVAELGTAIYIDEHDITLKQDGQTLNFKIPELDVDAGRTIYISTKAGSLELSKQSIDVSILADAKVDNEDYSSNVYDRTIEQNKTTIEANMKGSIPEEYVKNGDEITYTIEITNNGMIDEDALSIEDKLPAGVKTKSYTVIDANGHETVKNTKYTNISIDALELKAGTTIKIKITVEVVESLVKGDSIVNSATISGSHFDKITTNEVTYKIKKTDTPDNPNDPNNPSNPDNPNNPSNPDNPDNPSKPKYEISGLVWVDTNANGQRNVNEELLKDVKVYLMNNKTSEYVKDEAGNVITILTDSNGAYKFTGLEQGEYIVVFEYNTTLYKTTAYKTNGVTPNINSDAISGEITMSGVKKTVAMTDIINLADSDISNIDLGLVQSKTFDLKLDKQVNTVIVQNKQGTRSFTFKNNKLAKIEIPSKYMVGSNITVEYKILVTNEGDVPGKVGKIVDYMPNDMTFTSEINNEWYKDTDGNVYTTELADTIINPGETKEVTLVLTKTLKEQTTELTNNSAEIYEDYNTLGLQDIDSTPGNNSQKEDDLSLADMIITIKTGAGTYVGIVLGIMFLIAILAGGIYLIKRKVLVTKI